MESYVFFFLESSAITRFSNLELLNPIRATVEYGNLEPVVAIHEETTTIAVSEKILNSMHECQAGIINVSADEKIPGSLCRALVITGSGKHSRTAN